MVVVVVVVVVEVCVCVCLCVGEGGRGGTRRSPSACSRDNCRGTEAGKPRPFRPPGQGTARRCAHEAAVAAAAGAGHSRPFSPPRQNTSRRRAHEATVAAGAGAGQLRSVSAAATFRTFAIGRGGVDDARSFSDGSGLCDGCGVKDAKPLEYSYTFIYHRFLAELCSRKNRSK